MKELKDIRLEKIIINNLEIGLNYLKCVQE
jgi:hypothetical protein